MKIIIIEDESFVAEDLAASLKNCSPDIQITAILTSVKEATAYFSENPAPDLIFSDIQLGDGLSFEIMQAVSIQAPVIFCTAFNEYALDAFKANGIEYILKPFSEEQLRKALHKYTSMRSLFNGNLALKYHKAMETISRLTPDASQTIMVKFRDRLLPFTLDKIALFYVESETTVLHCFNGKSYIMAESLEELEKRTAPLFFRINRQQLVSRRSIAEVADYFPRRLKVSLNIPFHKEIFVSREKRSRVLDWLARS
ncbi:LytR/AlgR family response regulator transcription factor [Flavobacterium gelatinilyticum]|uniref:LytR/AlgR family response regulator transcription factor n=1 Tax=Flavobacterium gelatinilyticum TaxID=3003260 RepID=UPI002480B298|nr:LytTR family DNA-binding domain-containing protein [Flavobacterium gelatinilyticum]